MLGKSTKMLIKKAFLWALKYAFWLCLPAPTSLKFQMSEGGYAPFRDLRPPLLVQSDLGRPDAECQVHGLRSTSLRRMSGGPVSRAEWFFLRRGVFWSNWAPKVCVNLQKMWFFVVFNRLCNYYQVLKKNKEKTLIMQNPSPDHQLTRCSLHSPNVPLLFQTQDTRPPLLAPLVIWRLPAAQPLIARQGKRSKVTSPGSFRSTPLLLHQAHVPEWFPSDGPQRHSPLQDEGALWPAGMQQLIR